MITIKDKLKNSTILVKRDNIEFVTKYEFFKDIEQIRKELEEIRNNIPKIFIPQITPESGNISSEQIKRTTITAPSQIASYNFDEVKLSKNFGAVWFSVAGQATLSDDRKSITIDWDFSPNVNTDYTLVLPQGSIVLENGDTNEESQTKYTVI